MDILALYFTLGAKAVPLALGIMALLAVLKKEIPSLKGKVIKYISYSLCVAIGILAGIGMSLPVIQIIFLSALVLVGANGGYNLLPKKK